MKLSVATTVALSLTAAAVPHARRHAREHRRDMVVETVTATAVATTPGTFVYVDQDGAPQYTSWGGQPAPATTSVASEVSQVTTSAASSTDTPTTSYGSTASAPSSPAPSGGSGGSASGYGLSWSPYLDVPPGSSDAGCKTPDQLSTDFEQISGYSYIRLYGTDCDQTSMVLQYASLKGMKVFAGIYDINNVTLEAQAIVDAAKDNWDAIHTVSVGNELVNNGLASADQVVSAIGTARGILQEGGYQGDVVTVDTFVALKANPSLCENSDYAAANCHPFFDGSVDAAGAGQWVNEQISGIQSACGGKDVIITETGWPSQGDPNNMAVPSADNQRSAIESLKSAFSNDAGKVIFLSAYNELWKENDASKFWAENSWGIYGNSTS